MITSTTALMLVLGLILFIPVGGIAGSYLPGTPSISLREVS